MPNRPQHIAFARLADLVEGRLPENAEAETRAHLATCARCAGQAAELERVTHLMLTDESVDAPRDLLSGAINLFRGRASRREPQGLRRLLAMLSFDSGSSTPAFGVRSGQAAPARQLLFSAGELSVDLRLAEGGEGWTISGQVLGPCDGGEVEIIPASETQARVRAALNNLCEFILLPPVAPGLYTVRLRLGETEVEIPELDLRA